MRLYLHSSFNTFALVSLLIRSGSVVVDAAPKPKAENAAPATTHILLIVAHTGSVAGSTSHWYTTIYAAMNAATVPDIRATIA